jgi:hypothetical protein
MSQPTKTDERPGGADDRPGPRDLTVTIHNEDNGEVATVHAGPGTPVRTIVERMYREFNLEQQPGDRLQCEGGDDVFAHLDEHLGDYAEKHCPKLVWLFAGDQGGA